MSFDNLRINDYVRFTESLETEWHTLTNPYPWQEEPFNCTFFISHLVNQGKADDEVEIECVDDCGAHGVTAISRATYETISTTLSRSLLRRVTMEEFGSHCVKSEDVQKLTFEAAVDEIIELLADESLPLRKTAPF
jgi:hypothetical protein